MAKIKIIKRVSVRKKPVRVRSKTVSFFIGAITVLVIGFLLFQYAQSNNYKTVLGEKIIRQNAK